MHITGNYGGRVVYWDLTNNNGSSSLSLSSLVVFMMYIMIIIVIVFIILSNLNYQLAPCEHVKA